MIWMNLRAVFKISQISMQKKSLMNLNAAIYCIKQQVLSEFITHLISLEVAEGRYELSVKNSSSILLTGTSKTVFLLYKFGEIF